jgi:DeoR/GlpR family transcriptional regulator of sugar metabolism
MAEIAAARIESLAAYLAQLASEGKPTPGTSELAARYDVTTQTIRRWLARIDQDASK